MLTVNIYKILLSEKYEVKDTEQNSVIGDRIKDLLRTMFPETDGYWVRMYTYKNIFYKWFIRVTKGAVSGFVVQVSIPKKNKLFLKIYEETKFSTEYNGYSVLFIIITFLTVSISRLYLHKEKFFLVAIIYIAAIVIGLVILKKILQPVVTIVIGKKISTEDINHLGEKLKERLK